MATTIGTTTNSKGIGIANSRPSVYSSISGAARWYTVYYDGSNLVWATSPDNVTWTAQGTVPGYTGDPGGNTSETVLLADSAGKLYLWAQIGGTGQQAFSQYTATGWGATPDGAGGGSFDCGPATIYETGGHIYYWPAYNSGHSTIMGAQDPTNATSFTNPYGINSPSGYSWTARTSGVLEVVGSNWVNANVATNGTTPELIYYTAAASPIPGSSSFPTASVAISNANLQTDLAAATDGSGVLHVVYRVSGTGWLEATWNGTSWTTGGALTQITDSDRAPALMTDGSGTLHLFYARFNAANDYGIGHISKTTAGAWTAQTDVVAHNAVNRTNVTASHNVGNSNILVVWMEGTGSPWNVVAQLVSTGGGAVNGSVTFTGSGAFSTGQHAGVGATGGGLAGVGAVLGGLAGAGALGPEGLAGNGTLTASSVALESVTLQGSGALSSGTLSGAGALGGGLAGAAALSTGQMAGVGILPPETLTASGTVNGSVTFTGSGGYSTGQIAGQGALGGGLAGAGALPAPSSVALAALTLLGAGTLATGTLSGTGAMLSPSSVALASLTMQGAGVLSTGTQAGAGLLSATSIALAIATLTGTGGYSTGTLAGVGILPPEALTSITGGGTVTLALSDAAAAVLTLSDALAPAAVALSDAAVALVTLSDILV